MAKPKKYIIKLTDDKVKELKSIIRKKKVTVSNTISKYTSGGIDAVTEFKRNINSDNARCKVDGRTEPRLIELTCGPVPEGHSRWTIRLLEKESKAILETPVSREAIRNDLKKQTSTS